MNKLKLSLLAVPVVLVAVGCGGGPGSPEPTRTATVSPTVASVPTDSTPAVSEKPKYTTAQENAIKSAQSYVDLMGFSRAGLIEQLSSKSGEGFSKTDATFAADHVNADWKAEAVEAGKSYLDLQGFSRSGLIEQLTSPYGGQFTKSQAIYAADKLGL